MLMDDMALLRGLAGGILIGLAALLLLAGSGKIAGISGIAGRSLTAPLAAENRWRGVFLIGLLCGSGLFLWIVGGLQAQWPAPSFKLILAAGLVGVGTRLGAGCTSGHGVCGIGRQSLRSVIATLVFMLTAIVTVAVVGR